MGTLITWMPDYLSSGAETQRANQRMNDEAYRTCIS